MSHSRLRYLCTVMGALAVMFALAGCKHKAPPPPPAPPAAPAPAPTVTLNADPTSIQSGQSSTLTWSSQNATKVELNGAAVDLNGTQTVSPTESTDYEVVAYGANNQTANASQHITVTQPPPPPPPAAPTPSIEDLWQQNIKDAYFDYDKSNIRPDAQEALQADATFLKQHTDVNFIIEGHCDDRGSAEYNMGLGDRRANAVKDYLVQLGVDASHIRTISYGKEKPFCTDENETCWQSNRRGHLVLATGASTQ